MKKGAQKATIAAVVCGFCVLLLSGGIFAYLIATASQTNLFTVGENVTRIEEEFEPPETIVGGQSYEKRVTVRNEKSVPCYVRVFAEFADPRMAEYLAADWNREDWTDKQDDGYYYYKRVLPVGEATEPLFTTLRASKSLTEFQMIVYSESVQSKGFPSPREAFARLHGKEVNKDE